MKKFNFGSKAALSLILCSSLVIGTTGCTEKPDKKDKKDSKKNIYRTEEEDSDDSEDSDSDEKETSETEVTAVDETETSNVDSPQKSNDEIVLDITGNLVSEIPVKLSPDAPSVFHALTDKFINGNWVDDNGIFFKIDGKNNSLVDAYGNNFTIEEVLDDGLMLRYEADYFSNNNWKCNYILPIPLEFFMPMYSDGDTLTVGENVLYRADSSEGKAKLASIYDEITNGDFTDYFGDVLFNEDGSGMLAQVRIVSWKYEDGILSLQIFDDDMDYKFMLRKTYDDCFCLVDDNAFAFNFYDKRYSDACWFYGDYISWDCVSCIDNFCTISPDQITFTSMDQTLSKTSDFKLNPLGGYCTIPLANDELVIYEDSCIPYISTSYDIEEALSVFVRRDSVFGQIFLYREDVEHGFIENYIEPEVFTNESDTVKISVEFPGLDDLWKSDYVGVQFRTVDEEDYYMNSASDELGPIADVCVKIPGIEYVVTVDVKMADGMVPEQYFLSVCDYESDYYDINASYLVDYSDLSDDTVTFKYSDTENYTFQVVTDTTPLPATPEDILDMPPTMSTWANSNHTGDILGLVDMDYISDSIVEDDGTAIFWVSTVEELASATYYVNSLDLDRSNNTTMFYIHLLNDIDLEGYNWVSLGSTYQMDGYNDYQHMFQGVIFGNGYSIKNLYIEDESYHSFLSHCHLATVIGLTLENPMICVNSSDTKYILIDDLSCITEVFDTKIVFDKDFEYCYEFSETGNSSLNYFDCSFVSVDSSTGTVNDIGLNDEYESFFYNGDGNWLYDYYTASGEYAYDAAGEFADYQRDRAPFIDGSYYALDKSFVPGNGYLDIEGWYDGMSFNTEFGYSGW